MTPPVDESSHPVTPDGTPAPAAATDAVAHPIQARNTNWHQLTLICVTQFMAWAGFGAILPYLPLFLQNEAGAEVWMIGVVASAYFVGTFFFSWVFGQLSDVIGRKPVILTGVVLYTVATFLFVTTKDPWWFVVFRFIEGMGAAAAGPAGNAFVADITPEDKRSSAFGWLTTAQFGGLIAGPVLGGIIVTAAGGGTRGFYTIFLIASGTMALIGVLLAIFLHEPKHVTRRRAKTAKEGPQLADFAVPAVGLLAFGPIGMLVAWFIQMRRLVTKPIAAFVLIAATSHFAMGAWEVIWSLWLDHLGASLNFISLTWALFSVPMLLSFLGGMLADRYSRFWLMFSGYTFSAFCWILYGSTRNLTFFLVVSVLEGLAIAWSYPAKQAFLVQVSPRRWLGAIQGIETTSMQLAALIGTLTAPLLYSLIGGYAIGVGGVLALIGLGIAAPILHAEWKRLEASGERLSAKEAERLAREEATAKAGHPEDELFTAM